MDLGTVSSKLRNGTYGESTTMFKDDVQLVFSNAMLYNKPETNVYKMAVKVKEHFDSRYDTLEKRLARSALKKQQEMASKTPIPMSRSSSSSSTGASRKKRASGKRKRPSTSGKFNNSQYYQNSGPSTASNAEMNRLKEQMRQMQAMIDSLAKSNAAASTAAVLESTKAKKSTGRKGPRPLSFDEKRILSEQINELPSDKLTRVLHIISESMPLSKTDDVDEIEIDIDSMDTKTLRRLQRFVRTALVPKKKKVSAYKDRADKIAAATDAEIKALESRMGDVGAGTETSTTSKIEMMDSSSGSSSEDEEILQNGMAGGTNPYSSYY